MIKRNNHKYFINDINSITVDYKIIVILIMNKIIIYLFIIIFHIKYLKNYF